MEKNNLFYERLTKAIEKSGKSANCVERELGYSRNALHNYKNGTEPSGSRLIELAQYFNISPEYLIGKQECIQYYDLEDYFQNLNEKQKLEIYMLSHEWIYKSYSAK
ncbi:helix-turn-helix domain-containing protein [Lactococcus lactis]|uniref:helix-turn-helix domain-containing protein n=1 Tax=Lactococcus lactis TaxID=1358 RepID=UPI00071DEE34|nr:helix-turn-helix transcriptional regulator [Lactococcus lactis]MCT0449875.1 XRE family transcriptional regulator [Lactococcus lactis subsp. lactis]MCT1192006.1 XRE family transcriptional regulator [Lactococcus lactis]MCT3092691.1 XRE family transcriptional regulator [Lactococcus lactis]MDG4986585.1 helix-turn-helix domain-containing protein [Lactococcus lactis]